MCMRASSRVPLRLPLSGTGALWSEGKYDSSPGQPKRMRKVAVLLTLTMLLTSLAGCAGDDESASPVGEWWKGDGMIMHIIEDGTLTDGEGNSGTWSTEGDILTITIDEANEDEEGVHWFNYAVEISPGIEWMWLQMLDDDDCHALHPEGISNDEYDDRVSELTPPSFC